MFVSFEILKFTHLFNLFQRYLIKMKEGGISFLELTQETTVIMIL